jgi:hypothetical protein
MGGLRMNSTADGIGKAHPATAITGRDRPPYILRPSTGGLPVRNTVRIARPCIRGTGFLRVNDTAWKAVSLKAGFACRCRQNAAKISPWLNFPL